MSPSARASTTPLESQAAYELCVIGAGITGMNVLVVASGYLPQDARVAVFDSRPRVGGMWVDTYDHVRLHQPHGIFTAGNIKWSLQAAPNHLATKSEVLDHFQRCLDLSKRKLRVDEGFGWDYLSHREADGVVEVTFRRPDGQTATILTKKLVKAFGHHLTPNDPLVVSSSRVRSITPELMPASEGDLAADDAPIWIVGGGKTAMDAAQLLLARFPGREVNLLAGPGTVFSRRDTFFPVGAERWWSGTPINTVVRETSQRFDGTNEDEVRDWFRTTYGISPSDGARDFFGAFLSEAESTFIKSGLASLRNEYLADAVDREDHVDLVLRSGKSIEVPPGTWLVNCTGSLLREEHPYEPFVSPSGRTISLQMRSSTTGVFSAFAGYYLTHLMFRDKLLSVPLYALDMEDLFAKAKPLAIYASWSLSMHNLSLISEALPKKALLDCGLDYDRWYPAHRRLLGSIAFLRTHRDDREHHRKTLDTIRDRFDVVGGPLEHG